MLLSVKKGEQQDVKFWTLSFRNGYSPVFWFTLSDTTVAIRHVCAY